MSSSNLLELLPDEVRYTRQVLPDDQNAYGLWLEAFERFHDAAYDDQVYFDIFYGTDDGKPAKFPTGAGFDRLSALVESNRQAFHLLDQGVRLGRLQLPVLVEPRDTSFDTITTIRAITRMRCVGAKLLCAGQQFEKMTDEMIQILRLGALLCNGEGTVIDQIVGRAVIRSALYWIEEFADQSTLSSELRAQLLSEIQQSKPSTNGLIQSHLVDLSCCSIPMLEKVPENTDLKTLVEYLSEHWYNNTTMGDLMEDMGEEFADEQISPEVREARLGLRKRQMLLLLHGHPKPFDKTATARLVGEDAAEYIRCIDEGCDSPETVDLLAGLWPEILAPGYPLDSFGFDPQAIKEREELLESLDPEERAEFTPGFKQPTDAEIVALNPKLRRVDNPVGQLLRNQLRPTDLSYLLSEHDRQLQATRKSLQSQGSKRPAQRPISRLKTPPKRT